MNRVTVAVMVMFVLLLMASGLLAYFLRDQPATPPSSGGSAVSSPAASEAQARHQVNGVVAGRRIGQRLRRNAVGFSHGDRGAIRVAIICLQHTNCKAKKPLIVWRFW